VIFIEMRYHCFPACVSLKMMLLLAPVFNTVFGVFTINCCPIYQSRPVPFTRYLNL